MYNYDGNEVLGMKNNGYIPRVVFTLIDSPQSVIECPMLSYRIETSLRYLLSHFRTKKICLDTEMIHYLINVICNNRVIQPVLGKVWALQKLVRDH